MFDFQYNPALFFENIFLLLLQTQHFQLGAVEVFTHVTNTVIVFYWCHYLKSEMVGTV